VQREHVLEVAAPFDALPPVGSNHEACDAVDGSARRMLEWAGQGVMMGNAVPELRTMAKIRGWMQAPPNDQDGVAVVLEAAVAKVLAAKA